MKQALVKNASYSRQLKRQVDDGDVSCSCEVKLSL